MYIEVEGKFSVRSLFNITTIGFILHVMLDLVKFYRKYIVVKLNHKNSTCRYLLTLCAGFVKKET